MRYTDFLGAIEVELNKKVKEGVSVHVRKILKNNTTWKYGVMFHENNSNEAPTIFLEDYFEAYQKGESLESIAGCIICFYENLKWMPVQNLERVLDFEYAKQKIVPKLINREQNHLMLQEVPYVEWMDLAIVFYLLVDMAEHGITTMQIQNTHMKEWKLGVNELFQIAMRNAVVQLPAELLPISAVVAELVMEQPFHECNMLSEEVNDTQECMYILTNEWRSLGAVCITYPHIAEIVADLLGESFYILPSSIHEVLIVPESRSLGFKAFATMISEVNMTQVSDDEILTDHAYYYDKEYGVFRI